MHRQQMGADGFLGRDVVDICARDTEAARTTADAGAAGGDGGEVGGIGGVAEVEDTVGGDGVAEALEGIECELLREGKRGEEELGGQLTAVRVGHTQSNMSAPRATETTRSSGYPTPIT